MEGPVVLSEALVWQPDLVEEIYITPTALERYDGLAERIRRSGLAVEFASEEVIEAMADTVTPQGCVAVCRQNPTALKRLFAAEPRLLIVLEEVRDPGNLGTIIRLADATGADGVVLTGRTVDPFGPKTVRSTTGSIFHVPVAVGADLDSACARARATGMKVLAADMGGVDVSGVRQDGGLAGPTAWVFGNEARGLDERKLSLADEAVGVPLYGHAESMNLATAASVCLYETAFAQRDAARHIR